jgi:hypothetical protein
MNLTLTLDSADPQDCELAFELLRSLREYGRRAPATTPPQEPFDAVTRRPIIDICRELLDSSEYGGTRLQIVQAIAEGSPLVRREEIYGLAMKISPDKDPGRVVGGLHKSLETSWKRLGGPGVFFSTTKAGFWMDRATADAVLSVLVSEGTETS